MGLYGGGSKWSSFFWGIAPPKFDNRGDSWLIDSRGNYQLDNEGKLVRDPTVATRCRIRLSTRRGQFALDPELGSRLHEIQITKNADRQILDAVTEALEPLIDDGSILSFAIDTQADLSRIYARITVEVPGASGRDVIPLGPFQVGAEG